MCWIEPCQTKKIARFSQMIGPIRGRVLSGGVTGPSAPTTTSIAVPPDMAGKATGALKHPIRGRHFAGCRHPYHRPMTTSWCPQCRSEFREGFTECPDCGVALVAMLPPEPGARHVRPPPTLPLTPDDVAVELVNLSAIEAELVAAQLRNAGIPAEVVGVGITGELVAVQYTQGSRVMVRRRDLAAARAVIAELPVDGPTVSLVDDDALAAQAEAATDWSDPESGAVV